MAGDARRLISFDRKPWEARAITLLYVCRMTYQISGLNPSPFRHLIGLSDEELKLRGTIRMIADKKPGFPCRVTLDDADIGQTLLLVNHVSHDGGNPYRASHAIFVGEGATEVALYQDEIPPALDRRILSLRAFNADGMMIDADLAQPGEADAVIRRLLSDLAVDHIDAHNAIRGCFAARIDRS